jgi:dolichol kinase
LVLPHNWDAYAQTIPLMVVFILFSLAIFAFCMKTWKQEKPLERRVTEVSLGFLFLVAAALFPPIIPPSRILLINIVIIATATFLGVLLISQIVIVRKLKKEGNTEMLQKRNHDSFRQAFENKFDDLKHDTARKSLHLISPSVILICVLIGKVAADEILSLTLIVSLGSVFLLLFAFVDIVRLLKFEWVPPGITNMFSSAMKKHEIGSFTATFDMVLGMVPAMFFLPLSLVAAIGMISALADAAASVVGKRWGSHKFPKGGKKSIEGYVAGSTVAFIIGYVVILIFGYFFNPPISFIIPLAYAGMAALVFFILDVLSLPIDDNILNPVVISLTFLPLWLMLGPAL